MPNVANSHFKDGLYVSARKYTYRLFVTQLHMQSMIKHTKLYLSIPTILYSIGTDLNTLHSSI